MRDPVNGKVVMITGASAGVGRALSRSLAEKGCKLGLVARGQDGLDATKREVIKLGGDAISVAADVSDFDAMESAASAVEREFGAIDVWINNAMVSMYSPFWEIRPDEFKHITEVTYLGQVYGTMAALSRMRLRNRGTIVQVGSALALRSIPLQSAYCGAKHAVDGFTESIRSELFHEKSDIKITIVHLPALNTPQFDWTKNRLPNDVRPTGPIFQPEVAAEGILFAAENATRKRIIIGAPTLEAIVGQKFIPGILDHYLSRAAWEGSLLPEPSDPNKPDNFWAPLPGDHGAHGKFDESAKDQSLQLWATKNRTLLMTSFAALGLGFLWARRPKGR